MLRAFFVLLFMFFASPVLAEEIALPDEPVVGVSIDIQATAESSWIFKDQGETAYGGAIGTVSADVCYDDACISFWRAQAVDDSDVYEVDLVFSNANDLGFATLEYQAGVYFVPGREITEFKLGLSKDFGEHCSGSIAVDVMRGGFEDTVGIIAATCTWELNDSWSFDLNPQFAYGDYGGSVLAGEVGVNYLLTEEVYVRFGAKGFSGKDSGSAAYIALGVSF